MSPLTRLGTGRYRHERLGVDVQKTAMPEMPWQIAGCNAGGSGVVYARTLGDAYAFLHEIEQHASGQSVADAATGQDRRVLVALHRYLFPERYEPVPTYEWHADTLNELAGLLEHALAGDPDARLVANPT